MYYDYQKEVRYLYSLQKYGIKFGLSKTSNLLRAWDNPHLGQNFIHVAGTNGKGSVSSFISSILQQAGYKVGMFSSPHLVRFTERFQINSREIDQNQASRLIYELGQRINPQEPPTFFEAVTAMAIKYFQEENTDISILEVGMGGRLDATNIVTPLISIITNISLEHKEFLGNTLSSIAREKAGIIKEGIPLLSGANQKKVIEVFQSKCNKLQAPYYQIGRDFKYRTTQSGLHYYGFKNKQNKLQLSLAGQHQYKNAVLALAATELLEDKAFYTSLNHRQTGLKKALWPGRMHIISKDPYIILDGGHNPSALKTLASSIKKDFQYRKLILVLGIMADKDVQNIVKAITPLADSIIFTRPRYERALDPTEIEKYMVTNNTKKTIQVITPLEKALDIAKRQASWSDLVLVTGSLFTVGEALIHLDPKNYQPDIN